MKNWEKIAAALPERGLDAALLLSPVNRFYATSFRSSAGQVLITKSGLYFMTDFRYIEAAKGSIGERNVFLVSKDVKYSGKINEFIKELGIKKLGYEENYLTVSQFGSLKPELNAALEPFSDALSILRASKEDWEIAHIRDAQRISERAFAKVLKLIKPGMTERELAAEIVYHCYKEGADKLSFDPIVTSGPNSSYPHGVPTDRKVQPGDFITIDFGSVSNGYCSDMTRTIAVGRATDEMKDIYNIVLKAQQAGIAAARAGIPGKAIDKAARDVIVAAGYGEYFGHSFGHSLGIEVHETPNASQIEETLMPIGAVVTAEPGIYIPQKFGVRIEDTLVMRDGGNENLTNSPKELIIV